MLRIRDSEGLEGKGVTTVKQTAADDNAFRNRSKGDQAAGNGDVVPDWFMEREAKRSVPIESENASGEDLDRQAEDQEA